MKRREFVTLAGGAVITWPFVAMSQQQTKSHIAYLGASSSANIDPRQIEQFKAGLAENGLIDGQNVNVDYLWAEGSPERLRQHAVALANDKLAVIVTLDRSRFALCSKPEFGLQSYSRY
jgi:putative ABC transport system substrate-binding protein